MISLRTEQFMKYLKEEDQATSITLNEFTPLRYMYLKS